MKTSSVALFMGLLFSSVVSEQCPVGQFSPLSDDDNCRPCRHCGNQAELLPCSSNHDSVCNDDLITGVRKFQCDDEELQLGVFVEGRLSTVPSVERNIRQRGVHRTLCAILEKYKKRMFYSHKVRISACEEGSYMWSPGDPVDCRSCTECLAGTEEMSPCSGMQDRLCSFSRVNDTMQIFEFWCQQLDVTLQVQVYSSRAPTVSQQRLHAIRQKLKRSLCTNIFKGDKEDTVPIRIEKGKKDQPKYKPKTKLKKYDRSIPTAETSRTGSLGEVPPRTTVSLKRDASQRIGGLSIENNAKSELHSTSSKIFYTSISNDKSSSKTTIEMNLAATSELFTVESTGWAIKPSSTPGQDGPDLRNVDIQESGDTATMGNLFIIVVCVPTAAFLILGLSAYIVTSIRRRKYRSDYIDDTCCREDRACNDAVSDNHPPLLVNSGVRIVVDPLRARNRARSEDSGYQDESPCGFLIGNSASFPEEAKRRGDSGYHDERPGGFLIGSNANSSQEVADSFPVRDIRSFAHRISSLTVESGNYSVSSQSTLGSSLLPVHADMYLNKIKGTKTTSQIGLKTGNSEVPLAGRNFYGARSLSLHDVAPEDHDVSFLPPASHINHFPTVTVSKLLTRSSGIELSESESMSELPSGYCIFQPQNLYSSIHSIPESSQEYKYSKKPRAVSGDSSSSTSSSISMHIKIPLKNLETAYMPDGWLQKDSTVGPENIMETYSTSATTQTEDWEKTNLRPKPIFCTSWQVLKSFSNSGGTLTVPNSDLKLEVPPNAVPSGCSADIAAATFTNLSHLRQVLSLDVEEELVGPTAELHSSLGFQFREKVHLFLPHCLPIGVSEDHINVYHIDRNSQGELVIRRLPSKQKYDRNLEDTRPGQKLISDWKDSETGEDSGFFQLLPNGQLIVSTTGFCSYTCTTCKKLCPEPQIYMVATAKQILSSRPSGLLRQVNICLFLWDRKILIADFKRDYLGNAQVGEQILNVVEDYKQSLVQLIFCLYEDTELPCWKHAQRPKTRDPIFPDVKVFPLLELLCCHAKDSPRREEWLAESTILPGDPKHSIHDFQCYIDVTNFVHLQADGSTGPGQNKSKTVTLFIGDINNNVGSNGPKGIPAKGDMENSNAGHQISSRSPCYHAENYLTSGVAVSNTPYGRLEEGSADSPLPSDVPGWLPMTIPEELRLCPVTPRNWRLSDPTPSPDSGTGNTARTSAARPESYPQNLTRSRIHRT